MEQEQTVEMTTRFALAPGGREDEHHCFQADHHCSVHANNGTHADVCTLIAPISAMHSTLYAYLGLH